MAYDPKKNHLTERDENFLIALKNKFLTSLLAKVGPNSVRGHMIGKLLAAAEARGISWHSILARQLPATVEVAQDTFGLTPADLATIEESKKNAGEYITGLAEETHAAIRATITAGLQANTPPQELSRKLFQDFGTLNLDWRRIALTETAIAVNNGYLVSLPSGTVVVGDSSFDACPWCKEHIHNRAFTVIPEAPPEGQTPTPEQSAHLMWPGKTNVGRSRYPKDRAGNVREPHQLWHPCIPGHPHCRCRLRRLIGSVEMIQPGTNLVVPKTALNS
jgi:hypothetical protein